MKSLNKFFVFAVICLFALAEFYPVQGQVVVYSAPNNEPISPDYFIEVNGKPVPVYPAKTQHHDKKYSVAYFDFSGQVTVKIKTKLPLENMEILPEKYGIKPTVKNEEVIFTTDKPFNISIEPMGQNSPLLLFSNPIEKNLPDPKDPDVIYFGPGEHNPEGGLIKLKSNQTLYIAGGAVVNAGIDASGDNITICGRGILDGSDWEHNAGPNDFMVNATDCNNLVIRDIIIKGSYYWTLVPQRCDRVLIQNVRLAGSRVGNDDGINPCNSSNVIVRGCFFRTDDDSVSPKGITRTGGEETSRPVDNVLVEDCTFWVDFANGFRIATESSCPGVRNFTTRNIDFIHFPSRPQVQIFLLHPTGHMPMENLVFENIRINGENSFNLAKLTPASQLVGTRPIEIPKPNEITSGPGRRGMGSRGYGEYVVVPADGPYIHNVVFRNISTYNENKTPEKKMGAVLLQGISNTKDVSGILFENVKLYDIPVTEETPGIKIGNFVKHVQFK